MNEMQPHPLRDDASAAHYDEEAAQQVELAALRQMLVVARAERDAARHAVLAANERYQRTIYAVSHELRTPMTSIKAGTQVAARRLKRLLAEPALVPGDQVRGLLELLDIVQRQVDLQDRLISDLVDVSRLEAHRFDLRCQRQDLGPIIEATVTRQRALYPDRALNLNQPAKALMALVDADRIGQVLTHLTLNALNYSSPLEPVQVTVTATTRQIRVEVEDHGPGIATEELTRIWDPFYRVPGTASTSGSNAALGLGLYLCRAIISLHEGHIGVKSTLGEGSTFWFTVPR